ncbi:MULTISPECIES: transcriptional regulator [Flavobacteriaceae]|uniref:transcriptional regulator n=1 Tax=Oceanihabitans sp. 2_MG-2023 TaxID=3062661 RepID=UPI0026E254A9|nr:transcriptional regulator [Oceanihabitans sp. 2_MG-2023]
MTSILTGDIIKSRGQKNPEIWLSQLKESLSYLEPNNKHWEIYRGDSFQIEIKDAFKSFEAAIYIKAAIKMIKGLDVRLAIGIGEKTYQGNDVTESNGEAFIFSGETFETLKKEKQNLKIKTKSEILNKELNLYFKLALISMDHWTVNSAEIVKLTLENPKALQEDLGKTIGINQNAISTRQKRANLEEILALNGMFKKKINSLI